MVIDNTGVFPAPSKLKAIAEMCSPTTGLLSSARLLGSQFIPNYSLILSPLTDILRNKDFASKRARKLSTPWATEDQDAFQSLRASLSSPTVLAFPDPNKTFGLDADASVAGAGAALNQLVGTAAGIILFASHRFSRADGRRGPTERECMAVLWATGHYRPYLAGRDFSFSAAVSLAPSFTGGLCDSSWSTASCCSGGTA